MTLFGRKNTVLLDHVSLTITLFCTLLCILLAPLELRARETLTMFLGEIQVLEIDKIERVAIGNPKVASNSILSQGQLVLLADAVGVTTMHIWLQDGSEKDFDIVVDKKKVFDDYQELVTLLRGFQGVSAVRVGELTVVRGKVHQKDKSQYDRILKIYDEVLDLVTTRDVRSEISLLLEEIPDLGVREVGGNIVLTGEISIEYSAIIKVVGERYLNPDGTSMIMDLTRVHGAVAGKMIYMKVKIMELSKNITQKLGIDWGLAKQGLVGPSFEFGLETSGDGGTLLNVDGQSKVLTAPGGASLSRTRGYFGIATGIGSVINLSLQNGDGVILAEPQLSTRSGGTAEFHAGGEFPIATTSITGQVNVEFKKYGIVLKVEPLVDDKNNILAHIETEISNIDYAHSFGDYVGLLTRNTTTDVSMRGGETLVIAGLVQNSAHNNNDKVKWLGDVPVLGPLFRSQDFQNERSELVIFVTPHVYDASSPLNTKRQEQAERIQKEFDEIVKGKEFLD